MDIPTILAFAVLGSITVNTLHWRGRSGELFFYYPQTGLLRIIYTVWGIATIVIAVLLLGRFVPAPAAVSVPLSMTVAHALYSIARRQQLRKKGLTQLKA
jgi:hypothetical protein